MSIVPTNINVLRSYPSPRTRRFVTFVASQNWTVPPDVNRIKILTISGGGGGGGGSSNYVGGGGGSSAVTYADVMVVPGTELSIYIGGGGNGGTGGSSPTAGGGGGQTWIIVPNIYWIVTMAYWGNQGGAATSSANGTAGTGGSAGSYLMQDYGNISPPNPNPPINPPAFVRAAYAVAGTSGNGQRGAYTPVINPQFIGAGNPVYYGAYGSGGNGGGTNSNGQPGVQGIAVIWWGDE